MYRISRAVAGFGAAALSACSPVNLLNATVPMGGVSVIRDVSYGAEPRQKLDIYRPVARQSGRTGVVFFYGGAWNSGSKSMYPFVAATLARKGLLVFVPDYRLYPAVTYPIFLQDCARATVWAQVHAGAYGGDADDIFLMGHSAGAYNAAMLALNPSLMHEAGGNRASLRGMIGLAGPYDFLPMTGPAVIAVFNGTKNDPATQPISYVDASQRAGGAPPLLLLSGSDDTTVYPRNTLNLAAAVRAHGGSAEQHVYPGVDHIKLVVSIAPIFQSKDAALADILAFIALHKADK